MKTIHVVANLTFGFFFIAGVECRSIPAGELSIEEARKLANPLVQSDRAIGLSVGIIDGDRQFSFHLGSMRKGQATANDKTLYEIGSITKVFTGILLADAAISNKDLLNQTPEGDATEVVLPHWKDQSITWLDLATHQSGLPRLPDNFKNADSDNPYSGYDSTKAVKFLQTHKLRRAPRSEHEYSNFAVSWLGHMLCRRAGLNYEQLMASRITEPLEMKDTVIDLSEDQIERMATAHSSFDKETSNWEFADLPGAGGIRSTTSDMMKFMAANLNPPEGKLGDAIELAWKQHVQGNGSHFAMGLGWMIARDGQTRWHNGQTGGYHSAVFINRKLKVGVVVLCNTGPAKEVDTLAEQLVQRLAGMKVEPMKFSQEIKVKVSSMDRLQGRYELAPTFIFDVKVVDGRLMVGVTNQPTHEVYAKSESRWFYKVVDAELEFELGDTGPAKSVILHQNGIRQQAKRIQ